MATTAESFEPNQNPKSDTPIVLGDTSVGDTDNLALKAFSENFGVVCRAVTPKVEWLIKKLPRKIVEQLESDLSMTNYEVILHSEMLSPSQKAIILLALTQVSIAADYHCFRHFMRTLKKCSSLRTTSSLLQKAYHDLMKARGDHTNFLTNSEDSGSDEEHSVSDEQSSQVGENTSGSKSSDSKEDNTKPECLKAVGSSDGNTIENYDKLRGIELVLSLEKQLQQSQQEIDNQLEPTKKRSEMLKNLFTTQIELLKDIEAQESSVLQAELLEKVNAEGTKLQTELTESLQQLQKFQFQRWQLTQSLQLAQNLRHQLRAAAVSKSKFTTDSCNRSRSGVPDSEMEVWVTTHMAQILKVHCAQEQRETIQMIQQQLAEQLCEVEIQLDEQQYKQRELEGLLKEVRVKSESKEAEATAKLEEQRLLKELNPLIETVISLQQRKKRLVDHKCWIKALKYEIHKEHTIKKGKLIPYAICDGCFQQLYGTLFKCQVCSDYCVCLECKENGIHNQHEMIAKGYSCYASKGVSEFVCDGCDNSIIDNKHYHCLICDNYDLCIECEAKGVHSEHDMAIVEEGMIQKTSTDDSKVALREGASSQQSRSLDRELKFDDGTTARDIPEQLSKCFDALVHALLDDAVRNSVSVELHSQKLISDEVRNEATRVAGDPEQKALAVVHELFWQCTTFKRKLLTTARALAKIPAVNWIGSMMEAMFWKMGFAHLLSGNATRMELEEIGMNNISIMKIPDFPEDDDEKPVKHKTTAELHLKPDVSIIAKQKDPTYLSMMHSLPEPTLAELLSLKIIQWYDIGVFLGLDERDLKRIDYDNPKDLRACVRNMFMLWLQNDPKPSYTSLLSALVAVEDEAAIQELCQIHGVQLPDIPRSKKPEAIKCYVSYLKERYLDDINWPLFPRKGQWPPLFHKLDHYIDIKLIRLESLRGEKYQTVNHEYQCPGVYRRNVDDTECCSMQDLFLKNVDQERDPQSEPINRNTKGICVLVDGAPGIGKTTMTHKACKDWARNELWSDYELVVYLPLKDETFSLATELWQLFEGDRKKLSKEVAEEVGRVQGDGVMLILDGWDELPHLRDTSVIKKIVHRRLLRKCSLLITSRSHASSELLHFQVPDRHFEAMGLTHDQILSVFTSYFENDKQKEMALKSEINRDIGILNLCNVPLNLAIVLHVVKQEKSLPRTLTGLYTIFLRTLLSHHLSLSKLDSIDSLPPDIANVYHAFGELAFEGFKQNSMIFSEQHLRQKCIVEINKQSTLGLLTAFKYSSPSSGVLTKYQFTHLTIQEYLAAEHLARQPQKVQTEFVLDNISNEKFLIMLQFLFGIVTQQKNSADLIGLFAILCAPEIPRRLQILLRLAHEAQLKQSLTEIGSRMKAEVLTVYADHWSDYELQLLSCLIDHMQWNVSKLSTWVLSSKITRSMMNHHANCIFELIRQRCVTEVEVVATFHHMCFFLIKFLSNEGFNLTEMNLFGMDSVNSPQGAFRFIRQGPVGAGIAAIQGMCALLDNPKLIHDTQVEDTMSRFLSQGLCPQTLIIQNNMTYTRQTQQYCASENLNSVLHCIASGLEVLHLGGYLIPPFHAALIFGAVACSPDLKVLDLSNNLLFRGKLRNVAIEAFLYMLSHNKSLRELGLKECELDEEVLSLLALNNTTITTVNLDCTHDFPKTLDLHVLTRNLSILYLSHCYLDDEDASRIGAVLCSNTSLLNLHLDRNNISVGGAIHIFVGLIENRSLQHLSLGLQTKEKIELQDSISSNVSVELKEELVDTIAAVFQQNKTLKSLSVPVYAPFPDKSVLAGKQLKIQDKNTKEHVKRVNMISCMHYNFKVRNINSKSNTLLPTVLLPPEEFLSLVEHSSLDEIDLSGYNLTEPSTMLSLTNFLERNSTLSHLKLCACRLHELEHVPLRDHLFSALCKNQSLTQLTVDPLSALVLAGYIDKVNFERHVEGSQLLTIHTNNDIFELSTKWNNHA